MAKINKVQRTELAMAVLRTELAKAEQERDRFKKAWSEELMKAGQGMGASFENLKLQKQLAIIAHISAGRQSEAILELLDPAQICINIQVVYGEDETRNAAQDEMLKSVVKSVTDHLGALAVKREEAKDAAA